MDLFQVALLIAISAAVNGRVPVEEDQNSRSYSSSHDAEDENHGREIGYDLPLVKDGHTYEVDDVVANKQYHQAADAANEPWTASLSHGSMKPAPSVYPYFGIIREPTEFGFAREVLAVDNAFAIPALVKGGLAFDADLAKNYQLERESELAKKGLALQAEIASFADEGFAYYPTMELVKEEEIIRGLDKVPGYGGEPSEDFPAVGAETSVKNSGKGFPHNPAQSAKGHLKETFVDKSLDYVLENGLEKPSIKGSSPFDVMAAKEAIVEKEKAAWSKALKDEEIAELGLLYYPLLAFKNIPFELREAELKRETFEKIGDPFPAPPKFTVMSHSHPNQVPNYLSSASAHNVPNPEGFAHGGPMKSEFVKWL